MAFKALLLPLKDGIFKTKSVIKTALNRPTFNEDYDLQVSFMHINDSNVMFNA